MSAFEKQLQLNLNTGEVKVMPCPQVTNAYDYFRAMHILNQNAQTYGVVYLATPEAITALKEYP